MTRAFCRFKRLQTAPRGVHAVPRGGQAARRGAFTGGYKHARMSGRRTRGLLWKHTACLRPGRGGGRGGYTRPVPPLWDLQRRFTVQLYRNSNGYEIYLNSATTAVTQRQWRIGKDPVWWWYHVDPVPTPPATGWALFTKDVAGGFGHAPTNIEAIALPHSPLLSPI